ncbi:hypothetical protein JAO76_03670 [Pontibacter sp. BT310]|uniref:Outer membrane protein beta-barrel domain-containing protein n=1 Tax=Pontibacter populi TaxID=890055 RepID=A0ABS6X809_9BACT|nr:MULTISPECIES: hypothetical protein [Pontibacter]MBJ6117273.1 hypothetical protein [Pontibacter sp. BT310]MBR0569698.1 hypothetical protein [Microvirga sp. STS03]MBW3364126.1 hypothetical protein [Pontibacter populi]
MSSTDKKDYGELEQSMWQRFQDAEATPGPEVWSRIDHALAMQENAKYKKRALFYRQLAAACFILFVLAGSALVLHYKKDQKDTLLATTTQQQRKPIVEQDVTGNATIAANSASTSASPEAGNYSLTESANNNGFPEAGKQEVPTIAQAQNQNHSRDLEERDAGIRSGSASAIAQQNYSYDNADGRTIKAERSETTELIAGTAGTNENTGISTDAKAPQETYIPATQAIASVPDNYTSPATINPLLRRNAILGTTTPEENTEEAIAQQAQAGLALALNKPAESDKKEAAVTASRWNVGMGYGSTYFTQNINIPSYTVTPHTIFKLPSVGPQPEPKPSMSVDSEENMRDARIEFQENTQAAMSYNVDAKAGFRIGKRFKLLSGLGYSQNTSKTRSSYIVEQFLFNPRTNERSKLKPTTVFLPSLSTFTTDSVSVVKTKQPFDVDYSYQMLSIPLGMQVEGNLGQNWYWYATGSVAANFLMQTTIKSSLLEIASVTYSATDDSPFRKVQFSGNMGMGIGKRISNAVNVSVGPEYRSFFKSMLTDDHAIANQGRPYTIGLNMGVSYILGHDGE